MPALRPAASALAVALALVPVVAAAQDTAPTLPEYVPDEPTPPPAVPAVPAVPAPARFRPVANEPPVRFVLQMGADFGFETLLEVRMSDGSSRSIKANQGINGSIGAAFFPLDGGRFATQATIGIEYSGIQAANGSARWLAFPLDVIEFAYADPFRFGLGFSYLLAPSLAGDGVLSEFNVDLKNSLGIVFEGDCVWRRGGAGATRYSFGVRYVWQKLEAERGGPAVGANAIGIVLGFTG